MPEEIKLDVSISTLWQSTSTAIFLLFAPSSVKTAEQSKEEVPEEADRCTNTGKLVSADVCAGIISVIFLDSSQPERATESPKEKSDAKFP